MIRATTYGPRQVCLSQVRLPVGRVDVLVQVGALMIVKAAAARLGDVNLYTREMMISSN